jgi:hypothetical protein
MKFPCFFNEVCCNSRAIISIEFALYSAQQLEVSSLMVIGQICAPIRLNWLIVCTNRLWCRFRFRPHIQIRNLSSAPYIFSDALKMRKDVFKTSKNVQKLERCRFVYLATLRFRRPPRRSNAMCGDGALTVTYMPACQVAPPRKGIVTEWRGLRVCECRKTVASRKTVRETSLIRSSSSTRARPGRHSVLPRSRNLTRKPESPSTVTVPSLFKFVIH